MMEHLTEFVAVLNEPPPFADANEKAACEQILETFASGEVEEIASTSYAYGIVSSKVPTQLPENAKTNSALKEIRRHYVGEGRNATKGIAAISAALEYRREYRIDLLRSCFYENEYHLESDKKLANKYKSLIFQDLERQPLVVRGVDSQGHTVVYKPPRSSHPSGADEAFLLTQLYTAERAIANAEFANKQEKLCVIFNFKDYSSSNSPSKSTMVTLVKVLQTCYPERLGVLTILEPPFWMRALFNIVWPFLSRATAEKIKLAGEIPETLLEEGSSTHAKLQEMIANPDSTHADVEDYTQRSFYSCLDQ
jgi:CRAL/TRIO domain